MSDEQAVDVSGSDGAAEHGGSDGHGLPGQGLPGDWLLRLLVDVANELDKGYLSVTLFTSAGTFAGMLAGNRRWLSLFRESVRTAGDDGAAFADSLESIDELLAQMNADEDSYIGFIHLERAHHLRDDTWVPLRPSGIWRGAFGDVKGWTLGAPSA